MQWCQSLLGRTCEHQFPMNAQTSGNEQRQPSELECSTMCSNCQQDETVNMGRNNEQGSPRYCFHDVGLTISEKENRDNNDVYEYWCVFLLGCVFPLNKDSIVWGPVNDVLRVTPRWPSRTIAGALIPVTTAGLWSGRRGTTRAVMWSALPISDPWDRLRGGSTNQSPRNWSIPQAKTKNEMREQTGRDTHIQATRSRSKILYSATKQKSLEC